MCAFVQRWIVVVVVSCAGFAASPVRAADNYYMILFAYQDGADRAKGSHTFASFHKVSSLPGKVPTIETYTISWLPADGGEPRLISLPVAGLNLDLPTTLQRAKATNSRVTAWGPYRVDKEVFDRAVAQVARLNSGTVGYKMTDRLFRPDAMNCIHAVSDIMGPMLDTGTEHGPPATAMVRQFFSPWVLDNGRPHREILNGLGLSQYPIAFAEGPF
jgi:hypothetical protein